MTMFTTREQAEDFMEKTVFQCGGNLKSDSLITAYKNPFTDKTIPVVKYFWTIKDWDDYPSLEINIQCPDKETYKKIREAQETLSEIGITFTTGYGSGARQWNFNGGLEGYHFVRETKEDVFEYILREKEFNTMGSYPPLELVHDTHKNKLKENES